MKKTIAISSLIFFLIAFQNSSFAQIMKAELNLLVKLSIFQESTGTRGYVVTSDYLQDFLQLEFKIDTLTYSGFEGFVFVSVLPDPIDTKNIDVEKLQIIPNNCQEYILAIDKSVKKVYRLKGFFINDFPSFLMTLTKRHYSDVNSYKAFVENYSIEKLDLGCLYQAFKSYSIDRVKYPCLRACGQLD
jgi:hypothetical protein